MNNPKYIIMHCSDSEFGDAKLIDLWHKERGWKGIGYHFVILNGQITPQKYIQEKDGAIENGRPINGIGSHCLGHNDDSIGICLIGVYNFTEAQMEVATTLVKRLMRWYNIPIKNVLGHCETKSGKKEAKTCPNFDITEFRARLFND